MKHTLHVMGLPALKALALGVLLACAASASQAQQQITIGQYVGNGTVVVDQGENTGQATINIDQNTVVGGNVIVVSQARNDGGHHGNHRANR